MKALAEHLKKIDPNISDKLVTELVEIAEGKVKDARKEGFEEGYSEGIAKMSEMDEEHAQKLIEASEKLKEKYAAELKATEELLDEEAAAKLQKYAEKVDEEATAKLQELVEAIDDLHTTKLHELAEIMDENATAKLAEIVRCYEDKHADMVSEKVEEFIKTYLEEAAPKAQIIDSAKLERLEEAVRQMREILVVNDDFVRGEVKEALDDAKNQIDEKQDALNRVMAENMDLRKQIKKDEAARLLEQKTEGMKPAKAAYIEQYFEGVTDPKVIAEKLDEAVAAFDADENQQRDDAAAINEGTVVEVPGSEDIIKESIEDNMDDGQTGEPPADPEDPMVDRYVAATEKSYQAGRS